MKKITLILLALCSVVAYAADNKYDIWLNEEVKALITKDERDAFKKLKSDQDKEKFIADFWARRDPSPGTPANEFKDDYEKRLKFINENIKVKDKKSIDTDMGQTFLLLGQPTDQKKEGKQEEGQPAEKMTWVYKNLPEQLATGEVDIAFKADLDYGGYKFADKKSADLLEKARNFDATIAKMGAEEKTKALQMEEPPVTTPAVKTALDSTLTGTPAKDVSFDAQTGTFMTSEGQEFITLALSSSADPASRVGVRLVDSKGTVVKEEEFAFNKDADRAGYFQTYFKAGPGDYNLVVGLVSGDKWGGQKLPVTVQDAANKFSLSSLIFAKEFKQLATAKPEPEPYTFGQYKLYPTFDRKFTKNDQLIFFYEIYDFPTGSDGKPNVEETLKIENAKPGTPTRQNPPGPPNGLVTGRKMIVPSMFPLKDYESGDYTMTLILKNNATNESITRTEKFTVQ
jgi:GWxTD domain-containing protein